jgi:hypothetical protein
MSNFLDTRSILAAIQEEFQRAQPLYTENVELFVRGKDSGNLSIG